MREVAIIGYGRFGRLAAHYLKKYVRVFVYDKKKIKNLERGISQVSLKEAAQKAVVILAVPINKLQPTLHSIALLLHHSTLVIDVCSVKEQPIRWMKSILPKHVSILGTHPLFGPDSAQKSMKGRTIVFCPVRISKAQLAFLTNALKQAGLNVVHMSAQRHDKVMATTLFLTQFVGHALGRLSLPSSGVSTQNYDYLRAIIQTSKHDTQELFRDMYRYNNYASRTVDKVVQEFKRLAVHLKR